MGGKAMQINQKTRYIVFVGVLSLLSIVLYFIEIPLFSGYLKLDISDIPALFAGIMFGPPAGIIVEFIKNLIHLGFKGLGDTFGYGDLMNFLVGVAVVVPSSAVMRYMLRKNSGSKAVFPISGVVGIVSMVTVGILGNYLLAPPYFQALLHVSLTGGMLWAAIGSATVLNLIKSVMLAVVTPPLFFACKKYILPLIRE